MARVSQNSPTTKSTRKRNQIEKSSKPAPSTAKLAKNISTGAVGKYRRTWTRAKGQIRRVFDRLKNSTPADANYPKKGQIVLVDACNVGYAFGNQFSQFSRSHFARFSAEGVRLALQYFFDRNIEAYGLLRKFHLKPGKSSDWKILGMLHENGRLITTPCKEFPGFRRGASYDDRFMLEIGSRFGCAVVSNDRYRDIMDERPGWRDYVLSQRIGFEWINSELRLINN
ncbi:AAEL002052-PA [Aedes aegypti]|uniref:AAEL002052-PA n=1 Tax=Aedes aegypti TaxID=7159 RepID=Q17JA6_AEDAE|nr:AAEL002052-PA [Aedes aegypti]